ncbi:Protein of unknown function [Burkholderia sp. YR290]|uniref:DUF3443 family protein n=1 Tax=Paraburkholderia hospita TaxID=169430 RepID=UPI0009A617E5|nr:DUF3443 family protein [Paraburkholderia hospita]SKC65165.1 Protein of unknown function [Paraburkholderia hospita]SOE65199.1 Protein of unknown function [Burkholderia sp. YR290]
MKKLFSHCASSSPLRIVLLAASVALTACGGGGGDDNGSDQPVTNNAPVKPGGTALAPAGASAPSGASAAQPASPPETASTPSAASTPAAVTPASETGTPGNNDTPPPAPVADNIVPINIFSDYTKFRVVNMPYVTVTFCVPGKQGASQCATVDHMLLDTGSVGVRVIASALDESFAGKLPMQTGASNDSTGKAPIVQCALFASGFAWGSMRAADVTIGKKTARGIPIHLIGDSTFAEWTPQDCLSRGPGLNTVKDLGANGIVGIGHMAQDYPEAASRALAPNYYYCPTPWSCTAASVPLDKQTANPVTAFATDNNGTIIRLPALPSMGQLSVTGELVFGIGTRDNNALPAKATFLAVTDRGMFTTSYKGRTMSSYLDSGSNALFLPDGTIPVTPDDAHWFAPSTTQSMSATLFSNTGNANSTIAFSIANSLNLFALGYAAHDNLGGYSSQQFLWGLPFFYGRNVYTALSGMKAGAQTGPYVAF